MHCAFCLSVPSSILIIFRCVKLLPVMDQTISRRVKMSGSFAETMLRSTNVKFEEAAQINISPKNCFFTCFTCCLCSICLCIIYIFTDDLKLYGKFCSDQFVWCQLQYRYTTHIITVKVLITIIHLYRYIRYMSSQKSRVVKSLFKMFDRLLSGTNK